MNSDLFDVFRLARIPLAINVGICLLLSFLRIPLGGGMNTTGIMMLFAFAISLAMTLMFAYGELRKGAIRLTDKYTLHVSTVILKGMADLALAFTFMVLHIFGALTSGGNLFAMYVVVGALSASVMHFLISIHSFMVAGKACGLRRRHCANCGESVPSTPPLPSLFSRQGSPQVLPGPAAYAIDRKPAESVTANLVGETEGDRLIVPADDEV